MFWLAVAVEVVAAAAVAAAVAVVAAVCGQAAVAAAIVAAAGAAIVAAVVVIAEAAAELDAHHRWAAPTVAHRRLIVQAAVADMQALDRATVICQLQAVGPAPGSATVRAVSLAHVLERVGVRVQELGLEQVHDQEQE
jgi:hypothetical protein